jgi:TetR/AcrR family transcriptional regulator, transcriptional repressor for nem operon
MSKAEKTREYIIEKSATIFNMKGYAGTSLTDLIKATGLTKGAIYGNFENKDEVAKEVFSYSMKKLYDRMAPFIQSRPDAAGKLTGMTEFYRVNWKSIFEKGGCTLQNAAVEADDNLSFLKKRVQQSVRSWARSLERVLVNGQKEGQIRKDIDPSEYAYTIISTLEGGIMLGKIMNNQKFLFNALDRIDSIVKLELMLKKDK